MIKPRKDQVLLVREESDELTKSGLYIPDQAKKDKQMGIIKGVGSDIFDLQEGDRVIFGKYAGDDFYHKGEKYILAKDEEILAKIEEDKNEN